MSEAWIAIIMSTLGPLLTVGAFLTDFGGTKQKARDAQQQAKEANAKYDVIAKELNDFRTSAATTFATIGFVRDVDQRLASAVADIKADFRQVADRIDDLIVGLAKQLSAPKN